MTIRRLWALCFLLLVSGAIFAQDPLPSWNDTPAKRNLVDFVQRVTQLTSPDYVKPAERIATFDNDGTLWAEQPVYFEVLLSMALLQKEVAQHPEWTADPELKGALKGDIQSVLAGGEGTLKKLFALSHAGVSPEAFRVKVQSWLSTARHPTTGRPYTEMVYQPMLEVLRYLRSYGFKTYIVSGGEIEFIRSFAEKTYGIPPEQVIGTRLETRLEGTGDAPILMRYPTVAFDNNKGGKTEGISMHIGRRPIAAFGNSDGDQQMLEWTKAGEGARFALLVHHTDASREWAYDRKSRIGHLEKALDEAIQKGWTVVDMDRDWVVIYPEAH